MLPTFIHWTLRVDYMNTATMCATMCLALVVRSGSWPAGSCLSWDGDVKPGLSPLM